MRFEAQHKETVILNPTKGNARRVIPSEIRTDPLTGRTSRICHFMKLKWDRPDFDRMIEGTEAYCPFCPDKIMKITPCFPEEILPEGRMTREDMVLFPNIAPYDAIGAVATLSSRHYIAMTEISKTRIRNAFLFVQQFFRRIHEIGHPEAVYHIINWNYMPPAGSSLIHPHLQVFSSSCAPNLMRIELEAAQAYKHKTGCNYWDDLVEAEKSEGRRFLGTIGRTEWMSSYAPLGVAGDVLAVVSGTRCTLDLSEQDFADIATGLVNVISAYDRMGIYSFNMNFFTGAADDDFTRFHLLFSPRTFFNQSLGTPDVGALRNLFNESICMAFPEEINDMLKPDFTANSS